MNIQNTIRECSYKIWRKQAHVAGQTDEVDFVLIEDRDDLAVIRFALQTFRRNRSRRDAARFCAIEAGRAFAVADDYRDLRVGNSAGNDALRERFEVRTAAAQQHAYALLHKQKTLTQPRASAKLGLYLRRVRVASFVTGNCIAKWAASR
jgi:hypothetical protein